MPEFGIREAKTKLSQLVERAVRGEEIIITRNGTPAVALAPVAKPNRLASVRGVFKANPSLIGERFDELPEGIANAFGAKP